MSLARRSPLPVKPLIPYAGFTHSAGQSALAVEKPTEGRSSLTATGKPRIEVPLPSQEKNEGVMQYALSVHSAVLIPKWYCEKY